MSLVKQTSLAPRILLISTYELGHQPWNLASPLAMLARAGFDATGIDASVEPLPQAVVACAWFIGLSLPTHTATRLAARLSSPKSAPLIAQIRGLNPTAAICAYGLYAALNADYLLASGVDFVIGGEFEAPLVSLVQALSRGEPPPTAGVSSRDHAAAPHLARLAFAVPQRQGLPPLSRYAHLVVDDRQIPAGYVEASRGCLHTCLHCPITPIYQGRFFVVPQDIVLADIQAQVEAGAGHITFGDPDFLNGPRHALSIARALHREFPHVTFDITTKIEHILEHRALFRELKILGCVFVVSAVESFSDTVLAHLAKGHTRADIYTALTILADAGIPMRPSLLPFTPWTTLADYVDLLTQVEALGLIGQIDPVHYTIRLLLPPAAPLLDQPDAAGWLGSLQASELTYDWRAADPRLDALQREAAALVAAAADNREAPVVTFYRLKALALAAAQGAAAPTDLPDLPIMQPTPHLTESWFC